MERSHFVQTLERCWTPPAKKRCLTALGATAAFSFCAHGFLFANEFFSHDSATSFVYPPQPLVNPFFTSVGRYLIPIYEKLKGPVAAPWLIGLLFIAWMTLAALLVCQVLELRSTRALILSCAVLCTAQALSLTGATYIYCMDEYALALVLAAAAAALFRRGGWYQAAGVAAVMASLAVYQPYFTVAACLCMLAVMKRLTAGEKLGRAAVEGVRYVLLLAAGFLLYYGVWTGLCMATGVDKLRLGESILSGGGLRGIWELVVSANGAYWKFLFSEKGILKPVMWLVHGLILAALLWRLLRLVTDRELPAGNRVALAVLALALPTAFHAVYILMPGGAHGLTVFSRELFYLLPLMGMEPAARRRDPRPARAVLAAALCLVTWQHIVFANDAYLKKDLEKTATVSLATRLVDRIEGLEGYVPGQTPVAMVGRLDQNEFLQQQRKGFDRIDNQTGLVRSYAATYNMMEYITYYLGYPLVPSYGTDFIHHPEVEEMPAFPARGSVKMIEGTAVVRLS